jgi:hypothetical protein
MGDNTPQEIIDARKRALVSQAFGEPTSSGKKLPKHPKQKQTTKDMIIDPETGKYKQVTLIHKTDS